MMYRLNVKMRSTSYRRVYFDELFTGITDAFNRIMGGIPSRNESNIFAYSGIKGGTFNRGESVDQSHLIFADNAEWSFSTVDPDIANKFAIGIIKNKNNFAFNLEVVDMNKVEEEYEPENNVVHASQGIVLISGEDESGRTQFMDGSKNTQEFFNTLQDHSRAALTEQLEYDDYLKPETIVIAPIEGEQYESKLVRVRGYVNIATRGHFHVSGDPETVKFLCHMGFGENKNLGFGYAYLRKGQYYPRQRNRNTDSY